MTHKTSLTYVQAYAKQKDDDLMMNKNERRVRLFRNGRNQAMRIPRDFELKGKEAIIRREGARLIVEPLEKDGLLSVLAGLKPLEESIPDVDMDMPPLDDIEL